MTKKYFKKIKPGNRSAIATVVTSAILLAAVSIIGVMLLGWSQTSIAEQKAELNEVYDTRMNQLGEDLIYENVWFATPSISGGQNYNHLNVTFGNVGLLGLNVTSIQVTNVTGTNNTALLAQLWSDGGIVKSGSKSLNVTYPWDDADELDIIAFTDRGNQFITQVVVP